jgi:ubiquinone/menaquinone biosynthesis C-methylase UbiE
MSETLPSLTDKETKKQLREKNLQTRLFHVYDFASEAIPSLLEFPSESHLDVGTFDGFALHKLVNIADVVHSIDIDHSKLVKATNRSDVAAFKHNGYVELYKMDATDIQFPPNSFDSATIIEVFGAGFEGNENDVAKVFAGVHRVLKPGGVLVFTVKSRTIEGFLEEVGTFDPKGIALPRRFLNPILRPLFGEPKWYGQRILKRSEEGVIIPNNWSGLSYEPRKVDEKTEIPLFWIGVCQKPKN